MNADDRRPLAAARGPASAFGSLGSAIRRVAAGAAWLASVAVASASGAASGAAAPCDPSLGLPALPPPPAALASLGEKLFFDRRLSRNGTMSCAMCHLPAQGFTAHGLRTPVGLHGASLRRNAPTLLNVAHAAALFHDGRAATLEAQALRPLTEGDEMGNASLGEVLRRLRRLPDYHEPWRRAFPDGRVGAGRVAAALAAYERTLLAADSPFDRWRYGGQDGALDPAAQRGFEVFLRKGCAACHRVGDRSATFSDDRYHDTGVQARSEAAAGGTARVALGDGGTAVVDLEALGLPLAGARPDLGRHEVTGRGVDRRAFRTPTLRNVALTPPYMHDGSMPTLEAVLEHYAAGGWPADEAQDGRVSRIRLDPEERTLLLHFLHALSSPHACGEHCARAGRHHPGETRPVTPAPGRAAAPAARPARPAANP